MKKIDLQLNPYFFIPFIIWIIFGALAQYQYDATYLFFLFNTHYHPYLDIFFEYATKLGEASGMILIALVFLSFKKHRTVFHFLCIAACLILPALFTQLIKHWVNAPRPQLVFAQNVLLHKLPHWDTLFHHSFPSGHSTGVFSLMCFLAIMLPKTQAYWALVFFILAMTTAYSRIYLAAHFFEDVYVGSIVGTLGALLIARIFAYLNKKITNKYYCN